MTSANVMSVIFSGLNVLPVPGSPEAPFTNMDLL